MFFLGQPFLATSGNQFLVVFPGYSRTGSWGVRVDALGNLLNSKPMMLSAAASPLGVASDGKGYVVAPSTASKGARVSLQGGVQPMAWRAPLCRRKQC